MRFSHRELRAHRELFRLEAALVGSVAGITAIAVLVPTPLDGALAVGALAAAGALASSRGAAVARRYEADLRDVSSAGPEARGPTVAEVRSSVAVGRSAVVRVGPSPNRRRAAPGRASDLAAAAAPPPLA